MAGSVRSQLRGLSKDEKHHFLNTQPDQKHKAGAENVLVLVHVNVHVSEKEVVWLPVIFYGRH